MTHVIRPAARADILRQYRFYLAQDALDAATRFLRAVEQSIGQLVKTPEAGSPKIIRNTALAGLRSWPVKEFNDVRIYYLNRSGLIRILRVLHGKRDLRKLLVTTSEEP